MLVLTTSLLDVSKRERVVNQINSLLRPCNAALRCKCWRRAWSGGWEDWAVPYVSNSCWILLPRRVLLFCCWSSDVVEDVSGGFPVFFFFFFFFFLGSIVATRSSLLFLSSLSLLCNRTTTVGTNSKGKDCTNVQREISWRSYVIFGWASSSFLYQDPLSLLWYLNSMEYDSPPKQKKRDDAFITPLIGASSPFSQ